MPLQRPGEPAAKGPGSRKLELEERRRVIDAPAGRHHDQDRERIHPVRDTHDEGMDLYRLSGIGCHVPSSYLAWLHFALGGAIRTACYASRVTLDAETSAARCSPLDKFIHPFLSPPPYPPPSRGRESILLTQYVSHGSRLRLPLWQTVANF